MANRYENLYSVVAGYLAAISAAGDIPIVSAPSHYGEDFRITPGECYYQIQIQAAPPYKDSNISYPRAFLQIRLHFYSESVDDEKHFAHVTMYAVMGYFLDEAEWAGYSNVYGIEPGTEPSATLAEREGNVLTIDVTASVLMKP